jgi:Zn-finger nucleic acid-binding protein
MDATTIRCPQCGAATRSDARRCQYCRARLATVSCPSCFALMFAEADFCPKCGQRRQRTETPAEATCPGCRSSMKALTLGDTPLLECESCDGLWVDAGTFERICSDRDSQAAVMHPRAAAPPRTSVRVSYRPCVRCGTMMNRVNFGKLSGTVIDVCRNHGTFLDAGELQAIVTFIENGGLERARQREIEDLNERARQLKDQEVRLRSTRYQQPGRSATGEQSISFRDILDWMRRDP